MAEECNAHLSTDRGGMDGPSSRKEPNYSCLINFGRARFSYSFPNPVSTSSLLAPDWWRNDASD